MAIETHIHAFPRHVASKTYPEAVPVYDTTAKRIRVGDGSTVGGTEVPNMADLNGKAAAADVTSLAGRVSVLEAGATSIVIGAYQDITSVSAGNVTTFSSSAFPVGIKAPSGKCYFIEKETLTINSDTGISTLDFSAYLAYENMPSFSGTWRVYFACGPKGNTGSTGFGIVPGTVHAFAGAAENIPDGYLLCNGAAINRTDYADLFAAIGTIYGAGDESTTFNLPDFRGKFLRGYLDGTTAALGTAQEDAIRNIEGNVGNILSAYTANYQSSGNGALRHVGYINGPKVVGSDDTQVAIANIYINASMAVPTAAENRPVNYAINWIIKY